MAEELNIGMRQVLREAILGYIFWCLFQALAPMIWFYPLNELEISGYEAFALFLFSPILYGIPFVRRIVSSWAGTAVLRLGSVAAIGSVQAPDTLTRLIVLSAGCFCVMLVFTATLWSPSQYQRTQSYWGLILGLIAFIGSRIWYTSFVPAWWDNTANSVTIAIGVIATLDKIASGDDGLSADPTPKKSTSETRPNWVLVGCGLGSLLYLTQAVYGDVSLVTRWTVSGFPDTGPMPYPWGAVVYLFLFFGADPTPYPSLYNSWLWYLTGVASFLTLYYLNTWMAFAGGVVLGLFTMTCWRPLMDAATACPPARTMGLVCLVWIMETLFSVWTVAYNFVPGGMYTREHTDWLIAAILVTLGLGLYAAKKYNGAQSRTAFVTVGGKVMPNQSTATALFMIALVSFAGFAHRFHKQSFSHPPKEQPKADFSAAVWTYHFGYDNRGWQSLDRSAEMLRETGADVITLLESDASKPVLGNNDLGMWLGENLQMYVDFGPSTRDHTWGNLILSKYPIVKSKHHLLPSPHGELAPAVTATINMTGHLVDFVVTHMGNDRDVLDRDLQARFLADELKTAENPVVFLGYVTSAPGSRDYKRLLNEGNVKDIDSSDKDRWCEYIMYRGLIRLGYARISHGGLSDTEVQVGRFRIPENPQDFTDHGKIVTDRSKVDPDVRFSEKFGEYSVGHNWIQAHKYHMSTPKYFIPKGK